jgi:hypothetical protein
MLGFGLKRAGRRTPPITIFARTPNMANPFQFRLTGLLLNLWAALEIREQLKTSPKSMFREQVILNNKIDILKLKAQINSLVITRQNLSCVPWSWVSIGEAV